MKKFSFVLLLLLLLIIPAHGLELCHRSRSDMQTLLAAPEHRIGFKNQGGLMGGGVCWWHSRLQRSSLYLATYSPQLPKPSAEQARLILSNLRSMRKVVGIPGYENFAAFTMDFSEEVQRALNEWQQIDGFVNFAWIRGISGRSSLPPKALQLRLEGIFRTYLASPAPIWLLAQIRGITAHSFLLQKMHRTPHGFDLAVVDSNRPLATLKISYRSGDTALQAPVGKYSFVPYTGFQHDFRRLAQALKAYCAEAYLAPVQKLDGVEPGDLELE